MLFFFKWVWGFWGGGGDELVMQGEGIGKKREKVFKFIYLGGVKL